MCPTVFVQYLRAVVCPRRSRQIKVISLFCVLSDYVITVTTHSTGKEFYNKEVANLFREYKVHHFSTDQPMTKSSVVERLNRSIKEIMWKMFTYRRNHVYIDIIDDIMKTINSRTNRSIGMAPKNVTERNIKRVLRRLYKTSAAKQKPRFHVGDYVRISQERHVFTKGYEAGYTQEVFVVDKVENKQMPPVYHLKDLANEKLPGVFYARELSKTIKPNVFHIERVVRQRGNKSLVKWEGYPSSMNEWIETKTIHQVDRPL